MDRFTDIKEISSGNYGIVYKAFDTLEKEYRALKVCDTLGQIESLFAEGLVLLKADHRNIVQCRGVLTDKNKVIYIMDLLDTTLASMIENGISKNDKLTVLYQVACGLDYLHNTLGISHNDLKPENILYDYRERQLKICDFNSVKFGKLRDTPGTTIWYRSPESTLYEEYSDKSDVWSLGCIFYELITGDFLFPEYTESDLLGAMVVRLGNTEEYTLLPEENITVGTGFKEIPKLYRPVLEKMLKLDPEERIGSKDLVKLLIKLF